VHRRLPQSAHGGLTGAEGAEVLDGLGHDVTKQTHHDATCVNSSGESGCFDAGRDVVLGVGLG
jgi:hypothetical protein